MTRLDILYQLIAADKGVTVLQAEREWPCYSVNSRDSLSRLTDAVCAILAENGVQLSVDWDKPLKTVGGDSVVVVYSSFSSRDHGIVKLAVLRSDDGFNYTQTYHYDGRPTLNAVEKMRLVNA